MRKRLYDKRKRPVCIICGDKLLPDDERYMIALDGFEYPINIYIHRSCNDRQRIEEWFRNEKQSKIINFYEDIV